MKSEIATFLKKFYPNSNNKCGKYRLKRVHLNEETRGSLCGFMDYKFTPIVHQPDKTIVMKSSVLSLAINTLFRYVDRIRLSMKNFVGIGEIVDAVYRFIIENDLNNFHNRNMNAIPLKRTDNPSILDGYKGYQAVFFNDVKSLMIEMGFKYNPKPSGFYVI